VCVCSPVEYGVALLSQYSDFATLLLLYNISSSGWFKILSRKNYAHLSLSL